MAPPGSGRCGRRRPHRPCAAWPAAWSPPTRRPPARPPGLPRGAPRFATRPRCSGGPRGQALGALGVRATPAAGRALARQQGAAARSTRGRRRGRPGRAPPAAKRPAAARPPPRAASPSPPGGGRERSTAPRVCPGWPVGGQGARAPGGPWGLWRPPRPRMRTARGSTGLAPVLESWPGSQGVQASRMARDRRRVSRLVCACWRGCAGQSASTRGPPLQGAWHK
jgi:hypothetical protein